MLQCGQKSPCLFHSWKWLILIKYIQSFSSTIAYFHVVCMFFHVHHFLCGWRPPSESFGSSMPASICVHIPDLLEMYFDSGVFPVNKNKISSSFHHHFFAAFLAMCPDTCKFLMHSVLPAHFDVLMMVSVYHFHIPFHQDILYILALLFFFIQI